MCAAFCRPGGEADRIGESRCRNTRGQRRRARGQQGFRPCRWRLPPRGQGRAPLGIEAEEEGAGERAHRPGPQCVPPAILAVKAVPPNSRNIPSVTSSRNARFAQPRRRPGPGPSPSSVPGGAPDLGARACPVMTATIVPTSGQGEPAQHAEKRGLTIALLLVRDGRQPSQRYQNLNLMPWCQRQRVGVVDGVGLAAHGPASGEVELTRGRRRKPSPPAAEFPRPRCRC